MCIYCILITADRESIKPIPAPRGVSFHINTGGIASVRQAKESIRLGAISIQELAVVRKISALVKFDTGTFNFTASARCVSTKVESVFTASTIFVLTNFEFAEQQSKTKWRDA